MFEQCCRLTAPIEVDAGLHCDFLDSRVTLCANFLQGMQRGLVNVFVQKIVEKTLNRSCLWVFQYRDRLFRSSLVFVVGNF